MTPTSPRQILIVDDAADNRQILSDLLESDYIVLLAKSGRQGLERALQHLPDLILLDVLMADMNGFEVMQQLSADERTAGIAVMLITKLDTPEDEVQGLIRGAVDYITKPFNFTVVKARVKTQMRLLLQRHQLQTLATIDGLTGLSNRRHFDTVFKAEWSRAVRCGLPLSVAMLDVDHFKAYNDACGHPSGDRVLQDLARALTTHLNRPGDMVARYGGEEFVLLMPNTDGEGARGLAEGLRQDIEQLGIAHPNSPTASVVTVSIGLATSDPSAVGNSSTELLHSADSRLYRAKAERRNAVVGD